MSIVITVGPKPSNHPFHNHDSRYCFYLNEISGIDLELIAGEKYIFDIRTPGHPFYFTSSEIGGSDDDDDNNILYKLSEARSTGIPFGHLGKFIPTDEGEVSFRVPNDFPDTFYYQCKIHNYMGGNVHLIRQEELTTQQGALSLSVNSDVIHHTFYASPILTGLVAPTLLSAHQFLDSGGRSFA